MGDAVYEDVEIGLDDSCEEREENRSKRRRTGVKSLRQNGRKYLDILNAHPRDRRLFFDEKPHIYYIDGDCTDVMSVTAFVHRLFPPFDKPKIINGILQSYRFRNNLRYYPPCLSAIKMKMYTNASASNLELEHVDIEQYAEDIILSTEWPTTQWYRLAYRIVENIWTKAAQDGTAGHDNIENCLNELPYHEDWKSMKLVKRFWKDYPHWKIFRTEQRIFCLKALLAGSVDALYEDIKLGEKIVVDWKLCNQIRFEGFCNCGVKHRENCGAFGTHPVTSDLPASNYYTYSMQVNTYRYIYETHYGYKINACHLVVVHPDQDDYIIYKVPDMQAKVAALMQERKLEVKAVDR